MTADQYCEGPQETPPAVQPEASTVSDHARLIALRMIKQLDFAVPDGQTSKFGESSDPHPKVVSAKQSARRRATLGLWDIAIGLLRAHGAPAAIVTALELAAVERWSNRKLKARIQELQQAVEQEADHAK